MFLPYLAALVKDCLAQVRDADQLLACLDGPDVDSGTCVEIGYAIALGKPILGYRTDFRGSEIEGVNAMVRYGCTDYIWRTRSKVDRGIGGHFSDEII